MRSAALAIAFLAAPAVVHAQEAPSLPGAGMPSGMAMSPAANRAAPAASDRGPETLPNLAEREGWPQPTADSANYGYFLADLVEYRESDDPGVIRWDVFGWYGGDVKRLWVKSEGAQSTSKRADSEQEAQLLYGQPRSSISKPACDTRDARGQVQTGPASTASSACKDWRPTVTNWSRRCSSARMARSRPE
jgi:uncharacterized protein involved in copper resistance